MYFKIYLFPSSFQLSYTFSSQSSFHYDSFLLPRSFSLRSALVPDHYRILPKSLIDPSMFRCSIQDPSLSLSVPSRVLPTPFLRFLEFLSVASSSCRDSSSGIQSKMNNFRSEGNFCKSYTRFGLERVSLNFFF